MSEHKTLTNTTVQTPARSTVPYFRLQHRCQSYKVLEPLPAKSLPDTAPVSLALPLNPMIPFAQHCVLLLCLHHPIPHPWRDPPASGSM